MQGDAWKAIVSVLTALLIIGLGWLYKTVMERFRHIDNKIKIIIRWLIIHSNGVEKADLAKLIED